MPAARRHLAGLLPAAGLRARMPAVRTQDACAPPRDRRRSLLLFDEDPLGKAEPYRYVLRQRRSSPTGLLPPIRVNPRSNRLSLPCRKTFPIQLWLRYHGRARQMPALSEFRSPTLDTCESPSGAATEFSRTRLVDSAFGAVPGLWIQRVR